MKGTAAIEGGDIVVRFPVKELPVVPDEEAVKSRFAEEVERQLNRVNGDGGNAIGRMIDGGVWQALRAERARNAVSTAE